MTIRLGNIEMGWGRYLGLWTAVALLFAMQGFLQDALLGREVWSLVDYLRWSMVQWYTWAALAPWVFRIAQRHPVTPPLRLASLAVPILAGIGITWLALIIGALVSSLFEPSSFGEQLLHFVGRHFAVGMLTYAALFALQHALHYQAEQARRELEASQLATELAKSRLQVLKTQLQPHFLFNTLHAIITLLDEDTLSAEDMLLRLSELLRAFLEDYDGQEISLRRELELLELYLGIQRHRYGERLQTRIYVEPGALDSAVPSLLLQPLVENAIRHGIGRRVGSDRIEVEVRRDGDTLCIDVRNDNSELDAPAAGGHGIGLSNTRLRLRELYGEQAGLRLDAIYPRGVACRIRLPFRAMEAVDDDAPEHVPA